MTFATFWLAFALRAAAAAFRAVLSLGPPSWGTARGRDRAGGSSPSPSRLHCWIERGLCSCRRRAISATARSAAAKKPRRFLPGLSVGWEAPLGALAVRKSGTRYGRVPRLVPRLAGRSAGNADCAAIGAGMRKPAGNIIFGLIQINCRRIGGCRGACWLSFSLLECPAGKLGPL